MWVNPRQNIWIFFPLDSLFCIAIFPIFPYINLKTEVGRRRTENITTKAISF